MRSLSQSPVDDEFVQNPYPFYSRARSCGDLFHWEEYDRICAVSFESVNRILRDRRWGREVPAEFQQPSPGHLEPFMRIERTSMLELDPPAHTRLRGLVARAFTSRSAQAARPEIEALAERLVSEFEPPVVDLQESLAKRLPVNVIAVLLGVPTDMSDQLLAWSHDMVAMYQAKRNRQLEDQASKAASEFYEFISELISRRRVEAGEDLVSRLIEAEEGGNRLSEAEMISTCILLLNAGHEATAYSIGNGILAVLRSGIEVDEMLAPENISNAVEEILRFDPPLHLFERHAKEDLSLFGHRFCRGDTVALLLAAANRDPAVYSDPDIFDPFRPAKVNLAFGAGIHFCVGAPLARLEIAVALGKLFARYPDLSLAETPRYANRYHFHGLESLNAAL